MKKYLVCSTAMALMLAAALPLQAAPNPLDPSYMTPQEMTYWKKEVATMADSKGMVSKESFVKYYEKLWDSSTTPGKDVSVNEFTDKWAAMERKQANDPGYQSRMAREEHVKSIDVDKDGTISKEEFLKHMAMHWDEAEKLAAKPMLTSDQAMAVMSPLDPSYRHR